MNFQPIGKMKTGTNAKPKSTKGVLKRLWRYLKRYRALLILALFISLLSNVFSLIGPWLSGLAVKEIENGVGNIDFSKILFYCLLMIIFYVVSSVFSYILSIVMIKMSQNISYQMRKDVFDKLVHLPVSYFDSHQTGDILSKISYDIDTINTSLSTDIIQVLSSVITVIGALVMMIIISPLLSLVFVVTVPISIIFTKFMAKKTRRMFRGRSRTLGELNGFVEEMISGSKTIKAYSQEESIIKRFDDVNEKAVNAAYDAEYSAAMIGPSVDFINNFSLILISVFGSILYLGKKLSLGEISSFVLYSRKFSGPINETANIVSEIQSALAAAERVLDLIDEPEEPETTKNPITPINILGNIEGRNICFGYKENIEIIHNLSFKAPKGSMIAIVGPTGAGKTTLINLLMRFYDCQSGQITLDGIEITNMLRKNVRKNYAMVLQDTWLFSGTIYDNLVYGNKNATMEEAIVAAKATKIHSFISKLPNGYDTILSDDGVNISKGQKQLLTIARAYLQDARMLILDEATSNVDTRTEIDIQEAMLKLMKNKTCFVIAHRLSTIRNADLILVFKDGKIVEMGKHEELIEQKGFYNVLYNSQFENAGE